MPVGHSLFGWNKNFSESHIFGIGVTVPKQKIALLLGVNQILIKYILLIHFVRNVYIVKSSLVSEM